MKTEGGTRELLIVLIIYSLMLLESINTCHVFMVLNDSPSASDILSFLETHDGGKPGEVVAGARPSKSATATGSKDPADSGRRLSCIP